MRHIGIIVPRNVNNNDLGDDDIVYDLLRKVRKIADKQNIKLPKRISCGGFYESGEAWVCYNSNQVRDFLKKTFQELGVELGGTYSQTGG